MSAENGPKMSANFRDEDEFEDAVDTISHSEAPEEAQDTADATDASASKKKKSKKKKKKSKSAEVSTDDLATTNEDTGIDQGNDADAALAGDDAGLLEESSQEKDINGESTNDNGESAVQNAMTDSAETSAVAPDMPAANKAPTAAEEGSGEQADDKKGTDAPLGESTQQFEVTEDDLKRANESLEEKLDMLKMYDDDGDDDESVHGEKGASSKLEAAPVIVPESEGIVTNESHEGETVIGMSPTGSTAPPSLPDRANTAKPAPPVVPPRDGTVAPSLPPRENLANEQTPPALPQRKSSGQSDVLRVAAELPPPPLPPQLTERQKQHHRGSLFQSWFSGSRGSTASIEERPVDYEENYDLLLSRLNENNEDLSTRDEVSREQISSAHNTLKSSFAEISKVEDDTTTEVSELGKIDWSFWASVVNDYASVAKSDPSRLSKELSEGIPSQIRGIVWQLVSNSNPREFEGKYEELVEQESKFEKNIQKDLSRTSFADLAEISKESLYRVIKAYSNLDTEVGYTQGMAFITVPLLINMTELEAFALLNKLMNGYNLRSLFLPEMPGLLLKMFQFDRLVEDLLPNLYIHFQRQGIRSSMYASQWFLTFFAYKFPLEIVLRIFDLVITEGVESILKFAVALLKKNENTLLTLKFDDLLAYLKDNLFYAYHTGSGSIPDEESDQDSAIVHKSNQPITVDTYEVDKLVQDATDVKLLPITLKRYEEEWEEIHREEKERREEIEELRLRNNQIKKEIRKVEASYTILNREHVQIANEMIAGRMKIAELEDENKDLHDQNIKLRERVKSLQNPINEEVSVPAALEEDLKNTMERNLEVMTKNQELEDHIQSLLQEVENLKSDLEAEREKSTPKEEKPSSPLKIHPGGLWGKKLFK